MCVCWARIVKVLRTPGIDFTESIPCKKTNSAVELPLIFCFTKGSNVSKLSQKPKIVFKFEWEHFKLIFVRRTSMYFCGFAKVSNPQKITGSANCKSAKSQKYMVRKSKIRKIAKFRKSKKIKAHTFADLRFTELNFFADSPLQTPNTKYNNTKTKL